MTQAANKRKGEVAVQRADGSTVVLKFGTNAICNIEERLNKTLGEILDSLKGDQLSMRTLRLMVSESITKTEMSDEEVGDLIDEVGFATITKAFGEVFGADEAKAADGAPANPQPAAESGGASA